jgi:hypothetical protein
MYQIKASESLTTGAGSLGGRLAFRGGDPLVADKSSRQGPTPEMLRTYYTLILWLSGDLNSGVLGPFSNRSQNDTGIIMDWLASGSSSAQNRGFWAMGDGFVESSYFGAKIQPDLLANFLGVGLVDPNYAFFTGNTDDLVDLKLLPGWQGKDAGAVQKFGVRNVCLWTNDVVEPDGIGLTLGTVASEYERKSDKSAAAGAGVYKDYTAASPWKSLVDGWDIEHLTSRNDRNTVNRSTYFWKIFTNVWYKIWPVAGSPIVPLDVPTFDDDGMVNFVGKWANNPLSSGMASIQLGLARAERVQVKIFDVSGRLVRTLAVRHFEAGNHTLVWDGSDNAGRQVPRGVYFSEVTGPVRAARKITVLH